MSNELLRVVGRHRMEATVGLLRKYADGTSSVVEIGSNDASFRQTTPAGSWVTVDKYGDPDIQIDINQREVRLPFQDGTVDVVLCTEVLEHLTLGTPLVQEFSRILKPAGVAIVSVPNIAALRSRISLLTGGLPHLAASGDCGPPLGGTGVWDGQAWVAAHTVDFNEARLVAYLARSGLGVREFGRVPYVVGNRVRSGGFKVPLPRRMLNFVLAVASPMASGSESSTCGETRVARPAPVHR